MSDTTTIETKPKFTVKQLALVGLMTAVICVLGPLALNIPVSPVPISLGTLAIYFVVSVLGMKLGTISVIIYILLGLAGVPIFAGFTSGPGKLFGPTGGYIIVREDGEVLCYHLFNRNEFENYLISNTKFETASTSRHDFGYIYEDNGRYFLKLNLQIRFTK